MTPVRVSRRSRVRRWAATDGPRFGVLCLAAIVFLAPVYWMLVTSFKPEADTTAQPVQWIPARPTLDNYAAILGAPDLQVLRWFVNSLGTAIVFASVYVALCAVTAYPLARMQFPGRRLWFAILLSSMMLPGIVTLIPTYIMILKLGWLDSYNALIWPFIPGVFGVFLLRQFFLGVPRELEEAAEIDGANSVQLLARVVLPLSKPALVTLWVFSFLFSWNNYLWPLFVVHGDMQTLPVGLANMAGRFVTFYGKLMAGTALATIPVLIVYLLAQRQFVRGITLTGLKE